MAPGAGLNTYVVCPGLLYGAGEMAAAGLFPLFKAAWEAEGKLPLYGEGANYLPTCHVEDLARTMCALHAQRPTQQYLLTVDKTPTTLKEITEVRAAILLALR